MWIKLLPEPRATGTEGAGLTVESSSEEKGPLDTGFVQHVDKSLSVLIRAIVIGQRQRVRLAALRVDGAWRRGSVEDADWRAWHGKRGSQSYNGAER